MLGLGLGGAGPPGNGSSDSGSSVSHGGTVTASTAPGSACGGSVQRVEGGALTLPALAEDEGISLTTSDPAKNQPPQLGYRLCDTAPFSHFREGDRGGTRWRAPTSSSHRGALESLPLYR